MNTRWSLKSIKILFFIFRGSWYHFCFLIHQSLAHLVTYNVIQQDAVVANLDLKILFKFSSISWIDLSLLGYIGFGNIWMWALGLLELSQLNDFMQLDPWMTRHFCVVLMDTKRWLSSFLYFLPLFVPTNQTIDFC